MIMVQLNPQWSLYFWVCDDFSNYKRKNYSASFGNMMGWTKKYKRLITKYVETWMIKRQGPNNYSDAATRSLLYPSTLFWEIFLSNNAVRRCVEQYMDEYLNRTKVADGGQPSRHLWSKVFPEADQYSANIGKYHKAKMKYRHRKDVAEQSSFCHLWSQVFSEAAAFRKYFLKIKYLELFSKNWHYKDGV